MSERLDHTWGDDTHCDQCDGTDDGECPVRLRAALDAANASHGAYAKEMALQLAQLLRDHQSGYAEGEVRGWNAALAEVDAVLAAMQAEYRGPEPFDIHGAGNRRANEVGLCRARLSNLKRQPAQALAATEPKE